MFIYQLKMFTMYLVRVNESFLCFLFSSSFKKNSFWTDIDIEIRNIYRNKISLENHLENNHLKNFNSTQWKEIQKGNIHQYHRKYFSFRLINKSSTLFECSNLIKSGRICWMKRFSKKLWNIRWKKFFYFATAFPTVEKTWSLFYDLSHRWTFKAQYSSIELI